MSEVVGRRFKFAWTEKEKGAQCHQVRCKEAAVANRLCAKHGAAWLSQGQQPPMPEYENETVDPIEQLERDVRDAAKERRALAALPMRTHADAALMQRHLLAAQGLIAQTREKKHAAIRPLIAAARKQRQIHDAVIVAYRAYEDLARERLDQFTHLHDFAAAKPSKSGFPPRPQRRRESVAPKAVVAKKKKKGKR